MSEFKVAGFGRSGGKKTALSDQEEDFSNTINWSNSSDANRSDKDLGKLKMTHIPNPSLLTNVKLPVQDCSASSSLVQKGGLRTARGEASCHPLDWHPEVLRSKAHISSWFS